MSVRVKKLFPALKHGAYSAAGLLPGEDRAAFEKLYLDLRAEYRPDGPLEEDTVSDIARLLWRKQNLATFRVAEAARNRNSEIKTEMIPYTKQPFELKYDWTPPESESASPGRTRGGLQVCRNGGLSDSCSNACRAGCRRTFECHDRQTF